MKKYLLAVMAITSLLLPLAASQNANAQATRKGRAGARTVVSHNPGKTLSPKKQAAMRALAAVRKSGSRQAGDPCNNMVPITIGQTLDATLSVSDCQLQDGTYVDFYTFHGTAGQPIYLSETSGDFDTYLYLLDTDFNTIDENDDSGDGTDSRIPMDGGVLILPFTGDYVIATNSYDPESTGSYQVALATDASCVATPIAYNAPVNGSITGADCGVNLGGERFGTDLFTFNGTAGQQVSITMTSGDLDAYLILHTPSGDGSLEDDDSAGGTDARVPASGLLTLTETGTYTIEASTSNADEAGTYTLTVAGPSVTPTVHSQFDYDGDGKTDASVYRPSENAWYLLRSTAGFAAYQFGAAGDSIVPADYTGDGKTDVAIWRPSTGVWFILRSEDFTVTGGGFGQTGDTAAPGDYDGDGKADLAVYRPGAQSTFYVQESTNGFVAFSFGIAEDKPTLGDFDGDGKTDFAVYRPSQGAWYRINSSNNSFYAVQFGQVGDKIVPADYTGDGKTDIAIWREATGVWFVLKSDDLQTVTGGGFGNPGDIPTPGDYDGDGKTDFAVYRPGTQGVFYTLQTTNGFTAIPWGIAGDIPTPNAYVK